jgi:hypothetical protein
MPRSTPRLSFSRAIAACVALPTALVIVFAGCSGSERGSAAAFGQSVQVDTMVGHAPAGVRIKVEILNASKIHGAARTATFLLRARGYDVVAIGNAATTQEATTVLDRSGHPRWAELIAKAVGGKAVARPDTSRYLDATVVLGSSWTPPPMPFHP